MHISCKLGIVTILLVWSIASALSLSLTFSPAQQSYSFYICNFPLVNLFSKRCGFSLMVCWRQQFVVLLKSSPLFGRRPLLLEWRIWSLHTFMDDSILWETLFLYLAWSIKYARSCHWHCFLAEISVFINGFAVWFGKENAFKFSISEMSADTLLCNY